MDTHQPFKPLDEWFVAFVDAGVNLWWHRFCRPGFRHCFAFAYDPETLRWIVFDPTLKGFFNRPLWPSQIDRVIAEAKAQNGTFLRVKCQNNGPARPRVFATCVTVIQHLLGLKGCAVRPDGLYRLMLRNGATPAFVQDEEPLRQQQAAPQR